MNDIQYQEMHAKMLNWVRWCRSDGNPYSHCASIEHRYIPEKLTEATQEQITSKNAETPINHIEGENMDIALRYCKTIIRNFLIAWYYNCHQPYKIARNLRISVKDQNQFLRDALSELKSKFQAVESKRNRRIDLRSQNVVKNILQTTMGCVKLA